MKQSMEAREALDVFESAPSSAAGTTAVRNAAIALYAAVGRTDRAFALYEDMRTAAAAGDASTSAFNSAHAGASSGRTIPRNGNHGGPSLDGGRQLSATQPISSSGESAPVIYNTHLAPDTITYNTLIAACVAANRPQRAQDLYRDMVAAGVPRSARTYVSLMAAAARAAPDGEGATAAARVFADAEADVTTGSANQFTFTALIDAQVKGGAPEEALETFAAMKSAGVAPTVVTFGCLLNACRMIGRGVARGQLSGGGGQSEMGVRTNRAATDQSERAVERAYALLAEMTEAGVCPNDRCQNTLVLVVSEAGRIDDMLDEVKAIARRRGRFERATLEGVVRALCRASYAERALRIMSWMDVRGHTPRAPTYRELVQVCALEGQVVWAWTLHQKMRRLGHRPDRASCSSLVIALCRSAMATDFGEAQVMLRRAVHVFESAAATGVAVEGEGEATMWSQDEDDVQDDDVHDDAHDDAHDARDANGSGGGGEGEGGPGGVERDGMNVDQAQASFDAVTGEQDDDWTAAAFSDWPLDDGDELTDQSDALVRPAPANGEARRAKIPPNQVLAPPALRSLVTAAARCGEIKFALRLYRTSAVRDALRPSRFSDDSGNAEDGGARQQVFEALVEACCHHGDVTTALEVFDDFKALDISVSKVTLAFLESCCRRYNVPDYRVYDVCAQMRLQLSNKREARLSVPLKTSSHHVWGAVEADDEDIDVEADEDDENNAAGVGRYAMGKPSGAASNNGDDEAWSVPISLAHRHLNPNI